MLNFKDIAKIFEEIELRLIRSLKRNIGRHKQEEQQENFQWTAWQAEKLRNLDKFRRENAAIMNEYTDIIDSETRQLMEEQFKEGVNGVTAPQSETISEAPQVSLNLEPKFFGVDDTKVTKLIDDVVNLEKHAETAALRTMDDVYRQTVNKAQLAMSTGSITLQQAIDIAVKDFLDKGINCIVYRDGRRVNIADYVRMALRTTSIRSKIQGESAKYTALSYDTVQVTKYSMCSDTCLPWQGKVYINDVFVMWEGEIEKRKNGELWGKSNYCGKWFPLLSTALHGGLFHPNCRHSISLYVDGDPLPKALDNSEIEKRYKLEQKLRRLENNVRKAKRKAEGFSDPDNIKKANKELHEAQKKVREFIDQVNKEYGKIVLKRDYGRVKIYDENRVDKYPNSGIIESRNKKHDIPEEVVNDINKAVDKVAEDFPVIRNQVEPIEFADISPDLGENGLLNDRAVNVIRLSKDYCSDYSLLRQKLSEDFINHISYETDSVGSLTCHELGHAIHKILAMKRAGIGYGETLSPIKRMLFENELQKISIEIYEAAFDDSFNTPVAIFSECENQLGKMATDTNELIAQSFGNYYYGIERKPIAKSIVEYFMRELM